MGETDSEGELRPEQGLSKEAAPGCPLSKRHCVPNDWQREHGNLRSQDAFAEKHAWQDSRFLPGRAGGGRG